jgi:hypothetical protein
MLPGAMSACFAWRRRRSFCLAASPQRLEETSWGGLWRNDTGDALRQQA